ncbi:MAG: o-succinylbenzoate synthase [Bacteroidota bacterium]|nr:o-succinylbenzoate synthase [Bacteroidota bacterium]
MLKAKYIKHILHFKRPAGTSRGILNNKEAFFIIIWHDENPLIKGIGECGLLRGLSYDDTPDYEEKLSHLCKNINAVDEKKLEQWPSIRFAIEMAKLDLQTGGKQILFPSFFTDAKASMDINGLIWMGEKDFMFLQIKEKLSAGFSCIKMKIGAIDWDAELELLKSIRAKFPVSDIELRVDANGGFSVSNAPEKLLELSKLQIHSIEQPIKAGQIDAMAKLCKTSPIPIALDEELIGVFEYKNKLQLLEKIKPQYIILKPSLLGGFAACDEWIEIAEKLNIGWWITSALESNIGLNAIAQWTFTLNNKMPQGLGTGALYTNNIPSPLKIKKGKIVYDNNIEWNIDK